MFRIFKMFLLFLFFSMFLPNNTYASDKMGDNVVVVDNIKTTNINNTKPIKIGVIDSGVINNPSLNPYVVTGYNFIDNNTNCTDTFGHGTKVTSILVNNAKSLNLNIQAIPLKVVTNEGTASTENVVKAINYAVEQKVSIINISMASKNNTPELFNAINNAQANNIIVVAGVGNDGSSLIYRYPASYNNVISVGSVDKNEKVSWFSNYNDKISVVALGENISAMELDGSYGLHSGTSFSTPFATIEVALLKAKYPYTNDQIIKIIKETAIDKGDIGFDNYYGNGIINYSNALNNANEALKEYKNWTTVSNIPINKTWKISFNKLAKNNVDNIKNIVIIDEFYNIFPTKVTIDGSIITISPLINYKENTIYSLIISDLISSSNIILKDNIKMKFKTIGINKSMNIMNKELPLLIPIIK